jgi:hypothetical protein
LLVLLVPFFCSLSLTIGRVKTHFLSCLTPIVTGEDWNLVKEVDVNVRRAEAEEAMRAVRTEVAMKDARLKVCGSW